MMRDPLGSSHVNSQKQNREGVVRAQSRQYPATTESSSGCGGGPGRDVTIWYQGRMCADEDVGPLRGVDFNIPHRLGKWILYALYVYSYLFLARGLLGVLALGSIGTPKLSEFAQKQFHGG
ncbi:hypothetical protein ACFX1Q_030769 [Malus domestica]